MFYWIFIFVGLSLLFSLIGVKYEWVRILPPGFLAIATILLNIELHKTKEPKIIIKSITFEKISKDEDKPYGISLLYPGKVIFPPSRHYTLIDTLKGKIMLKNEGKNNASYVKVFIKLQPPLKIASLYCEGDWEAVWKGIFRLFDSPPEGISFELKNMNVKEGREINLWFLYDKIEYKKGIKSIIDISIKYPIGARGGLSEKTVKGSTALEF